MKELLNYSTITQITDTHIFAVIGGEHTSFPVTVERLEEAYKLFVQEFDFYNRMLDELCMEQKAFIEEKQMLESRLERLEKRRAENATDSAVRRGLATVCWEIEVVERALAELASKMGGVAVVQNNVVEKTVKYLKLRREAEAVYNRIMR